MVIPHIGIEQWINSLDLTLDTDWRPWFVGGQVAGLVFLMKYIISLFFLLFFLILLSFLTKNVHCCLGTRGNIQMMDTA